MICFFIILAVKSAVPFRRTELKRTSEAPPKLSTTRHTTSNPLYLTISRTRHTFISFNDAELIYNSSRGTIKEHFKIISKIVLLAVVMPSQLHYCSNKTKYEEKLNVRLSRFDHKIYVLEALGNFTGNVSYASEITIPFIAVQDPFGTNYPPVLEPTFGDSFYQVEIDFEKSGYYPWFIDRRFSSSFVFAPYSDRPGIILGFEYALD